MRRQFLSTKHALHSALVGTTATKSFVKLQNQLRKNKRREVSNRKMEDKIWNISNINIYKIYFTMILFYSESLGNETSVEVIQFQMRES